MVKSKKFDNEITKLFQENQIFVINTDKQLIRFLKSLFSTDDVFFYRGIDREETIIPTLLRLSFNASAVEKEYCMIKDLLNNGSLHLSDNSAIDILATAQHFGLPTRSLDWTNFFKALFFARGDGQSNNNNYIYILRASRNENIYLEGLPLIRKNLSTKKSNDIKYPNNNVLQEDYYHLFQQIKTFFNFRYKKKGVLRNYINELVDVLYPTDHPIRFGKPLNKSDFKEELYNKVLDNRILFVQPNFNNARISAQNALFSIATNLNVQNNKKLIKKNCKLIKIKKTPKIDKLIDNIFNIIGINAYTMMPDLSNICKEIKRKNTI